MTKTPTIINIFTFILALLLSIGYLTLLERNILGLSQNRITPNKTSISGLFQPLFDGMKLLSSELIAINSSETLLIFMGPALSFMVLSLNFINFPFFKGTSSWNWNLIIFLIIIGLNVLLLIALSFQSGSKYSTLGAMRAAAQGVTFDMSGLLLITILMIFYKNLQLNNLTSFFTGFLWIQIISGLALMEMGRSPFDLPEGESELVSGFNTELSANLFVLVFLSEYGALLMLSVLMSTLILGGNYHGTCAFMFFFLFSRAAFPRIRLDQSMKLGYYKLAGVLTLILQINWILHF